MTYGRTQAVLIGGAFNGILSALPIVGAANLCCCLWVMGGGAVTAWLLQQGRTVALRASEGAIGGALAGLAGAFFYTLVYTPMSLMMAPEVEALAELMSGGGVPPEAIEIYEAFSNNIVLMATISFGLWMFVGIVFSTIGGLLGALFASRSSGPPPTEGPYRGSGSGGESYSSGRPVVPPPPSSMDPGT